MQRNNQQAKTWKHEGADLNDEPQDITHQNQG